MIIKFSKHARQKIKEREINIKEIENTIKNYDFLFYDIESKTFVSISKTTILNVKTKLVVIFVR